MKTKTKIDKKTYLSIIRNNNTLLNISFWRRNLKLNQTNHCIFYACWSTGCMTCFVVEYKTFYQLCIVNLSNTSKSENLLKKTTSQTRRDKKGKKRKVKVTICDLSFKPCKYRSHSKVKLTVPPSFLKTLMSRRSTLSGRSRSRTLSTASTANGASNDEYWLTTCVRSSESQENWRILPQCLKHEMLSTGTVVSFHHGHLT